VAGGASAVPSFRERSLGGDSGGVAADWLAVGTLPLSYTASKAELVQQRELLARWNVVDHEECPALAALSTLLRRRKEFLSKSEELLRTREEQSIMGEPEDSHGVLEYCQVSWNRKANRGCCHGERHPTTSSYGASES
jgi:hypothetical protein